MDEQIFKKIDRSLERALANPITLKKLDKVTNDLQVFEKGGMTEEGRKIYLEKVKLCRVELKTLAEYQYLLAKLGFQKEYITTVLKHENAHGNVAETMGAIHDGYSVIIYRVGNRLGIRQTTDTVYPKGWTAERTFMVAQAIAEAPRVYENLELSDGDKVTLREK